MNRSCIRPRIERKLARYQFGELRGWELRRFEHHLLKCESCRTEATQAVILMRAMQENREALISALDREGMTLEATRKAWEAEEEEVKPFKSALWCRLQQTLSNMRWGYAVPAMAVAAATLFIWLYRPPHPVTGVAPHPQPVAQDTTSGILIPPEVTERYDTTGKAEIPAPNPPEKRHIPKPKPRQKLVREPYADLAMLDPLPYEPVTMKGVREAIGAATLFDDGMKRYREKDYPAAIPRLTEAVASDSRNGVWQLYLGLSYYLDKQPKPAIEHLRAAGNLAPSQYYRISADWYLAQAYLMENDARRAIPLLDSVRTRSLDYAARADSLLMKIKERER